MSPCETRPFRFLDLPKDIRRLVYDELAQPIQRPVLTKSIGLSFYDRDTPHSLLFVNHFVHEEVIASLSPQRERQPVVLSCDTSSIDRFGSNVISFLRLGFYIDHQARQRKADTYMRELNINFFARDLKERLAGAFAKSHGEDAPFPDAALTDFLRISVLRSRHIPEVHLRILVDDGALNNPYSSDSLALFCLEKRLKDANEWPNRDSSSRISFHLSMVSQDDDAEEAFKKKNPELVAAGDSVKWEIAEEE